MRGLLIGLTLCLVTGPVLAEQVVVAVASNFTAPMKEIAVQFEQNTGHTLQVSYGSSGKIYAQIVNGAPFQIFLSADSAKPQALEQAGLTAPDTGFTYATGRLALWSSKANLVDEQLNVLRQGKFNKLAIANPNLAPYGAAAVDVLSKLDLEEVTKPKWVQGENIAQTYQFVATGNADLGFVALSQLANKNAEAPGSMWIVPKELHRPINQDAVLLRRAENNKAARDFLQFLRGDTATAIIKSYGYAVE